MVRDADTKTRYSIPGVVTVQVDTREKAPLLFPSTISIPHPEDTWKQLTIQVKTEKVKLDYGDYRLKEYPMECVIERKGSQLEIFKNMIDSTDRIRQSKSFRKLTECHYPYILIEASPASLMEGDDAEKVVHRLGVAIAKYGLHVLWMPWKGYGPVARRKIGTIMVHLMLSYGIHKKLDIIPELI